MDEKQHLGVARAYTNKNIQILKPYGYDENQIIWHLKR